jgi:ketosteroid isomerase-like protein
MLEQRLEALEERVRELEAIEAIKVLHRDYLFYISELDFDRALECFTEDIVTEVATYGACRGIDAVRKFFLETIYNNVKSSKDAHFTGQAVIHVNGDIADGHWMFYRLLGRPATPGWVQGRYDCSYRKTSSGWKFSVLKMVRPWPAWFAEGAPGR